MNEVTELDRVLGLPVVVEVSRTNPTSGALETVHVRVSEVTMRNFGTFTATCAPFFGEFGEAGRLAERVNQETGDKTPPEEFALFQVLADHADAFMRAAELVTDKPHTFYQTLRPDQFFEVAAAVVKVNGDFFVRSLAPALLRVGRALGTIGSTASNS